MKAKAFALLFALTGALAASAPDSHALKRPDFTAFNLIGDRNIFNSSRSRHSADQAEPKQARVDTITLVGTLTYEKGPFAFFEGSGSDFRQVLEPGQKIAGFTVVAIAGDSVQLTAGANHVEMQVGMQLRREDESEWKVATGSFVQASVVSSDSANASSSNDDNDLIVKRLMQQREQDLK